MINLERMWAEAFFFFFFLRGQHVFWLFFGFCVKPWEDFVLKQIKITATFYRKNIYLQVYFLCVVSVVGCK